MEEQVGRVVGNVLAAGGEIFLPEVGSLCVERRRAQRLSRRSVRPPYRAVTFTPQRRGVSLVEEIARVLTASGMSEAEAPQAAQEVYGRWLERVREGETLTVCGVGVLKQDRFTLDEAFDRRLNPQGHAPVKVRSAGRPDWVIWIGAAAVAAAVRKPLRRERPEALPVRRMPSEDRLRMTLRMVRDRPPRRRSPPETLRALPHRTPVRRRPERRPARIRERRVRPSRHGRPCGRNRVRRPGLRGPNPLR